MLINTLVMLLLFTACATQAPKTDAVQAPASAPVPAKEFAPGELILATQLLTKIFDKEMAPLSCVPDTDEAALLLRTIRPRMEVVQDDMEAALDSAKEVEQMVLGCDKSCICGNVDELLREHLVILSKKLRKTLDAKKTDKELNRCMNYVQSTFCQSELYQQLNLEKGDFSFEE